MKMHLISASMMKKLMKRYFLELEKLPKISRLYSKFLVTKMKSIIGIQAIFLTNQNKLILFQTICMGPRNTSLLIIGLNIKLEKEY